MFSRGIGFFVAFLVSILAPLQASDYTDWTEDTSDPIYNPYATTVLGEDYFPCVLYDGNSFGGGSYQYKMWHQGPNVGGNDTISLSYSNDGVNWTLNGVVSMGTYAGSAYHPSVLYDSNGFGGSYKYKMWFWTGNLFLSTGSCQYSESTDGISWTLPQSITQSPTDTSIQINYDPTSTLYNHKTDSLPLVNHVIA